jgi:glutamine synthetase
LNSSNASFTPNGFISADHEREYTEFITEHPDIEAVEFLIVDPNGLVRGKWGPADSLKKAFQEGVAFPMSLHGLDVWGREVNETGLHIEDGDRDGFNRATRGSLCLVPWTKRKTAQVLLQTFTPEGEVFACDSRQVLKAQLAEIAKRGLFPVAAYELEFYLLEKAGRDESDMRPVGVSEGPDRLRMYGMDDLEEHAKFFNLVRESADVQGLPIDTIIKEAAPGQFEVNLKHRNDALRAADDVIMLKRIIHGCARACNMRATFMAKPFIDYAGNGMHVHCSVLDAKGNNIFSGDEGRKKLEFAIAGLLKTMPEALLIFINSWNGFRRITPGSYAPTQAVWAENNRSVALRVPASNSENMRFEHRISGADANPYLVMAALLQAMMEGMDMEEAPPPPIKGNAYEQSNAPQLPDDMDNALQLAMKSEFLKRALGKELAKVYCDLKRAEIHAFWQEITPLEKTTYR